ncbi:F-box protein At4g00755 [Malania oleifera]|uniref:F-box protein At4g00755 n=1 Tax=Malania oleifera TaxID=397392 RepID=UPI0025ADFB20|nr:F-box protein At4g00755 [Malania oleifera]XP_057950610.1 F-box protein At4g00755 [Malania oleifera]
MPTMEGCSDFIKWLGTDMSIKIFLHLEDPSDLVRICSVSSSWRQFVIANELCKQLCFRIFPEMSNVAHIIEVSNMIEPVEIGPKDSTEWNYLKRNHRVYAILARGLTPVMRRDCISRAISASSTDNYPEESIQNTLVPSDRVDQRASYWSSEGASDPKVPEILIYKLMADLCVITEVHVQPFQAYFQFGHPIYSAKAVRFRMGHSKYPLEIESDLIDEPVVGHEFFDNSFVWTYTSPEFPMVQENYLQTFKLPEPVLCVGGILQVELLGRVQRQEMDGLYYICVSHVQVMGRPLLRSFDVKILDPSGKCSLKHNPEVDCPYPVRSAGGEASASIGSHSFTARLMQGGARVWEHIVPAAFLENAAFQDDESDDDVFD